MKAYTVSKAIGSIQLMKFLISPINDIWLTYRDLDLNDKRGCRGDILHDSHRDLCVCAVDLSQRETPS